MRLLVLTNNLDDPSFRIRWGRYLERLGGEGSVFDAGWPGWDEAALQLERERIVIQINGKLREQMDVPRDIDREVLIEDAKAFGRIPQWIEGKEIRKVIVVPHKLVNIVVSG